MMIKTSIFFVATLIGSTLASNLALDPAWRLYKLEHGKHYASPAEEEYRRSAWEANLEVIEKHNEEADQGLHTYRLGANANADLTNAEFRAMMAKGLIRKLNQFVSEPSLDVQALPTSVDWRKKGCVTPVINQGQCGSSWAFAATGCIEGDWCAQTKAKPVALSAQQLMDCTQTMGNDGCNGGLMDTSFQYVIKNKGIESSQVYPYTAQDGKCVADQSKNLPIHIIKFVDIPEGNETAMQAATAKYGPIAIAVDASQQSFQLYQSGVYSDPNCNPQQPDHGALIIGYGVDDKAGDYWIMKNSWGASWGMNGYILIARNKNNMCGIATDASYVIF